MTVPDRLRAAVRQWIETDPDPRTAAELESLLAKAESDPDRHLPDLENRFAGSLAFGTAGLRGELAAGPNRMNRAVVIRTASGLASYLAQAEVEGPVVIGYDARHLSDEFARDTAAVMTAAGREALLLPRPLPTPLLAFAIRRLGAAAGVMVTASHNPRRDNGYKVYLGDGSQIVPPADSDIARHIDAAPPAAQVPREHGARVLDEEIVAAYVYAVSGVPAPTSPRDLSIVYTPLHGVGYDVARQALRRAGFADPVVVARQQEPDPEFPTVPFPNPEEHGALDLAIALAAESGADLVVANDPDADRCAVALPTDQGWRMLRGDEVGVLLADHLLRRGRTGVYATTIVSSSLLSAMAAKRRVQYRETLTGFKWIGRVPGLTYGYEEALGYCVAPDLVADKDGISALLLVCELAAGLRAEGRTLLDRLDEVSREFGVHATDQVSMRVVDLSDVDVVLARLRATPPTALGGLTVESVDDLSHGSDGLLPTAGLRFRLPGCRVVVRPSGTEPKLKFYLEVVMAPGEDVEAERISAAARLDAIRADLLEASRQA